MAKNEGHKEEMLKLIMEQNSQIKEMGDELEKLVKVKEQSVPMTVIPLQAVHIIVVSTISLSPTTKIPSVIPVTNLHASKRLVNFMKDMNLEGEEIKIIEEEINNI